MTGRTSSETGRVGRRVLLIACLSALAFVARAASPDSSGAVIPGDGGCGPVCTYYGPGEVLSSTGPLNRCDHVLPRSQRLACAGWNYWDRTRVWKQSGDWIRVGFWNSDRTMHYRRYYGVYLNPPIVVYRTDSGMTHGAADQYNASVCAWDLDDGAGSSVQCDAIIF
jgi:hypothetical protein